MTTATSIADAFEVTTNTNKTPTKQETIKVLHVDDDPAIQSTTKILLEDINNNLEIDAATSADEALKKMSTKNYDAILSDYEMPYKNGIELLKELKEKNNDTPFILFTGKGREEVAVKALNLGADGYYNKQGDPETVYGELAHGILKAIELSRAKKLVLKKEEKYSKAFNNSPYLVTITRLSDGKIIEANNALIRILGYVPEEAIGKTTLELNMWVNLNDRLRFAKELSEKGCVKNKVLPLRRKDGSQIFVNLSASLIDIENELCFLATVVDITEQRRAEERTKLFSQLFELVSDAVFIHDLTGKFLYFNESAYKTRGYTPEELLKMSVRELDSPNCPDIFEQGIKSLLEKGELIIERIHRCKDGSDIPVELHSRIITIGDQKLVLTVARDITERKKTEEIISKSEARYRELANFLPETVFEADVNGKVTFLSQQGFKKSGYTIRDFEKGLNMMQFVAPQDRDRAIKNTMQLIAGQDIGLNEYTLDAKDGTAYPALIKTVTAISENKVTGIRGIVIDITERKKAEHVLKQSEERFYKVFNDSPIAMMISRISDGVMVDINEACLQMLETSRQEAIGSKTTDLRIVIDDASRKDIWSILQKDGIVRNKELKVTTKTGKSISGLVSVDKITVNNQQYVMITCVDISARKMVEERLREDHAKLEIANEKLQVVGGLTRHDVRNKQSVIKANIYLLKKQIGNRPELLKYLEGIDLAVNQSDEIFEFSRLYEKIGSEEPSSIDVAENFVEAIKLHPEANKLSIINDCKGLQVLADSMLRQLFYNLIDNSIKHGKKVTQIKLGYAHDKEGTKLFYEDNGVGIPKENKDKIFMDGYTTGGSGLGLKLVKKMIEAYGWTIKENGIPDKGARFEITIPK